MPDSRLILRTRCLRVFVAAIGVALAPFPLAFGHAGPEHEIEELGEQIDQQGASADLLVQRAIEYAVLGRNAEAQRDLERALELSPSSLHARRELALIRSRRGHVDDAIAVVTEALQLPDTAPVDQAALHVLRAEFLRAKRSFPSALEDAEAALRLHGDNPEWYLLRSDLQRRLGLGARRVAGLDEGLAATGAGVLEIEKIEALLDDRRFEPALRLIEPQLAAARIQCRWLVLRGRALVGLDRRDVAETDLRRALAQIAALLDPARPDDSLLLAQATAAALLGETDTVQRAWELAREHKLDPEVIDRLAALKKKRRSADPATSPKRPR